MLFFISHFSSSLSDYAGWIFTFDGAGRLLWLSLFWFILEFITRLIARRNKPTVAGHQFVKSKDQGSWWLIALSSAVMAGIILLILHLEWTPDLPAYLIPVGILLMCLGIALRIWAVISLGKFFTMSVRIFSNHHLIQTGPYRWIRHPSYTGAFITTLGFGLATGYLVILIAFLIILGCAQGYRIYIEEQALKQEFGKEWTAYAAKTWKLIPWIW